MTDSPHGGVRPVHQKSTCLTQLTLGPRVVQIWSRNTPESGPNETFVLHRVDGRHSPQSHLDMRLKARSYPEERSGATCVSGFRFRIWGWGSRGLGFRGVRGSKFPFEGFGVFRGLGVRVRGLRVSWLWGFGVKGSGLRVEGSGWSLCEARIHNSQFKVALKRFTAILSSNCGNHNESLRF